MATRTALLDSLDDLVSPDLLSRASSLLGENQAGVSKAIRAAFTMVLGGMLSKANSTTNTNEIFGLVTDRENDGSVLNNVGSLLGTGTTPPLSGLGSRLLASVFGSNQNAAVGALSHYAGIRSSSASRIMALAAPLVLGFLGRQVRQRQLNAEGFMSMLLGQRERILGALPSALSAPLNLGSLGTFGSDVGRAAAETAGASRKWLWIGLLALAVLAGIWLVSRARPPAVPATQPATEAVGQPVSGLGAFVSRALPDGVSLNVPENGMESRLLAFLGDPGRPVDDTTWFDFDRIHFASASATLTPDSREQLSNLAAILRAYPTATFKVGGYTDNVGDPASNLELSNARANSVRNDLIALGVSADRLTAEGYGEQHPIASNATEEGRAMNRRMSLRVTQR